MNGAYVGLDAARAIGSRGVGVATLAGLVQHLRTQRGRQFGQRRRQHGVEPRRALAAAEDEQAQRAGARGITLRGRRDRDDLRAHRIADALGTHAAAEAAGEAFEHAGREPGEQTVGHARDRVLFVDHQRAARQPRREPARARGEAAGAEHDARSVPAHHAERLYERETELERRSKQVEHALAAQAADA